jgi:catechol 1,2-dioxygenase/hydroxyquinol 1,2-dioxygenase
MASFSNADHLDDALRAYSQPNDERLGEIVRSAVTHLYAFVEEVGLTRDEWFRGIEFLTAVGQMCDERRQEFILLSDTLGLSSLVNSLHDRRALEAGTKSSLLGPFYRNDSPDRTLGDSITENAGGKEVVLYGTVSNTAGEPIPNASVEIWQPDDEGVYDMQRDENKMDLRGHFHTGADGVYYCKAVAPMGYMIPMDGPVGDMIRAQKRHGYRPAHIHFLVGAPGYREVVTALYLAGDDHIDSDTVFGVTASLVTDVKDNDAQCPIPDMPSIEFNFQLAATTAADLSGRVGADPKQIVKE